MKVDEVPKQKERHIVTWTPEEDDILREHISVLGTESWTAIASKFKDKTSRQCRRRWYTYLSTEGKKGGWSPEEDMLLCEAQKIYGNRWTEIAKVVSGRTDNAVKNRFTTLCKKRAKYEAFSKENNSFSINSNNKRVTLPDGAAESTNQLKKIRTHVVDQTENCREKERVLGECGTGTQRPRPPLAVLVQNFSSVGNLQTQHHITNNSPVSSGVLSKTVTNDKVQGTFLKKDDPKIMALMQQAELLSSLALKVNKDNSYQSLENAWKELQDFLIQTDECDMLRSKLEEINFLINDFKGLIADAKIRSPGSHLSWSQPDMQEESQGSSEYSAISSNQSHGGDDKTEQSQAEQCSLSNRVNNFTEKFDLAEIGGSSFHGGFDTGTRVTEGIPPSCKEASSNHGQVPALTTEYNSPLQTIPSFQFFKEGIPSPKFTDSERQYLLRTLGLASPSTTTNPSPSQAPPCRRALLHSL